MMLFCELSISGVLCIAQLIYSLRKSETISDTTPLNAKKSQNIWWITHCKGRLCVLKFVVPL